ncbi:MAG: M15 family metallopeptidase [Acidobacteriota bacterium]
MFALGTLAAAWFVFPQWRQPFANRVAAHGRRALHGPVQWTEAAQQLGRGAASRTVQQATQWGGQARSQWRWIVLTLALLLLPAAGAWWWAWHGGRSLDAFDDRIEPGNRQVAHLLEGEHLVPPPPLPPDVFATAEVEQARPLLASADRRWDQMDAEFVQRLLLVFKIMRDEHGYDMALLEGYRSPERQDMLAAKGGHVTQAKAWQSYHQYGLAADCAFIRAGKLVITEKDPWAQRGYELYGQVAEQVGLTWGGRWQMLDLGHVEWRRAGARQGAPR